jgi:hypothetical protein
MMTPNTLTVAVNGQDYQIGRFTARQGSWILTQVLTKMLPSMIDTALAKEAGGQLSTSRAQLSEQEFDQLQGLCLSVCRRLENGVPMPIFVLPNTFAIKELEYDLVTVVALTIHALKHNITPFFQDGGLSQLTALLPALGLGQS